jgi:hypothetical protein
MNSCNSSSFCGVSNNKEKHMAPKTPRLKLFILAITVCASLSCSPGGDGWAGSVAEENGVSVVRNPREPLYPGDVFSLEPDLEIGGLGEDGEPLFVGIGILTVDDQGNIYVMDQGALRISVFDKEGRFLRRFGRKGQGPGEFQSLHNIILTKENTLMILDRLSQRLSYFTLDGELLKELSLAKMYRIFRIYPDGAGGYWARLNLRDDKFTYQLKKLEADLEEVSLVAEFAYPRPRGVFTFLSPDMVFAQMPGGQAVWGNSEQYELFILDAQGKLLRKVSKDHTPISISGEEKEYLIKQLFRGLPPSSEIRFPDFYPPIRRVYCDDAGRIFVSTYEIRQDDRTVSYDIFDPEGRFLAKMALDFAPRFWENGKLYTIEEDEEGFQFVKRYEVDWIR